jgi:hypothetical protein
MRPRNPMALFRVSLTKASVVLMRALGLLMFFAANMSYFVLSSLLPVLLFCFNGDNDQESNYLERQGFGKFSWLICLERQSNIPIAAAYLSHGNKSLFSKGVSHPYPSHLRD